MTNETFYLYNVIFDNTGTYKCDSSNLYFKFQSAYILQVVGMNTCYISSAYTFILYLCFVTLMKAINYFLLVIFLSTQK